MLLLDEHFSKKIINPLKISYPGITSMVKIREILKSTHDLMVLHYAKANDLVIVTKDYDFVERWSGEVNQKKIIHIDVTHCRNELIINLLRKNRKSIYKFKEGKNDGLMVLKF